MKKELPPAARRALRAQILEKFKCLQLKDFSRKPGRQYSWKTPSRAFAGVSAITPVSNYATAGSLMNPLPFNP
jgi:hypothetical protein